MQYLLNDLQMANQVIALSPTYLNNFLDLSGRKIYHKQNYSGQNIIVAVLDSGVSPHEELKDKLLKGKNFISPNLEPLDDHGHGTHVAGTIAGFNCGIAPQAKILPVKVLNHEGCGSLDNIINGLEWVLNWRDENNNKASIINMSLGGILNDQILLNEYEQVIKTLVNNGIAVIVSSGNTGDGTIQYPAAFNDVITVGAVDIQSKVANFSTRTDAVDVCQVGVNVLSANFKGGYVLMSGTSMATPIVSGIAALIAGKYKALFKKDIPEPVLYEMLKMNTVDIDSIGVDKNTGAGFCTLNPLYK